MLFEIKYIWECDPRPSTAINIFRGEHFSEILEEPRKVKWHPVGLTTRLLPLASLCAFSISDHKNFNTVSSWPEKNISLLLPILPLPLNQKLEALRQIEPE